MPEGGRLRILSRLSGSLRSWESYFPEHSRQWVASIDGRHAPAVAIGLFPAITVWNCCRAELLPFRNVDSASFANEGEDVAQVANHHAVSALWFVGMKEHGLDPSASCPFHVPAWIVADEHCQLGRNVELRECQSEGRGMWLAPAGVDAEHRRVDSAEQPVTVQLGSPRLGSGAPGRIGNDRGLDPARAKRVENLERSRINPSASEDRRQELSTDVASLGVVEGRE